MGNVEEQRLIGGRSNGATERSLVGDATVSETIF